MSKLSVEHNSAGWSFSDIENLINTYMNNGGEMYQIEEGSLGYGFIILHDYSHKLKTAIIQEYYINEWSSGHKVRFYNKCPQKYLKLIEQ